MIHRRYEGESFKSGLNLQWCFKKYPYISIHWCFVDFNTDMVKRWCLRFRTARWPFIVFYRTEYNFFKERLNFWNWETVDKDKLEYYKLLEDYDKRETARRLRKIQEQNK